LYLHSGTTLYEGTAHPTIIFRAINRLDGFAENCNDNHEFGGDDQLCDGDRGSMGPAAASKAQGSAKPAMIFGVSTPDELSAASPGHSSRRR
jgi:hypothetical protein